uniref:Uncharacterized protein n=1 Tax=Fagus sylvatica TaxID=28930 RepID=A0A2N9FU30_FAGSY
MPTTARFPVAGDQKLRPKSGRTPLQPKNSPANHVIVSSAQTKPKQNQTEIHVVDQSNKENHHQIYPTTPTKIESLDASLAEELSAIKKKLERLRSDKERTEKMLKERDMMLELKMKELEERGEIQNNLEIELDRLYRLKQLQSHSMRVSPIRSLRAKEQVKKISQGQSHQNSEVNVEDREPEESEFGDEIESIMESPGSASSAIVIEKS